MKLKIIVFATVLLFINIYSNDNVITDSAGIPIIKTHFNQSDIIQI